MIRWSTPYAFRLDHVAVLKASARVFKVTRDYYINPGSVNWLELTFFDDRTTADVRCLNLSDDAREVTDQEWKRYGGET